MDKKIAGLLGAAAALTTVTAATAATPVQTSGPSPVASYRDLLEPIPNAVSVLKADDARRADTAGVQLAGYYHHHHRYHHHFIVRPFRRFFRHHHHHHHYHHHY